MHLPEPIVRWLKEPGEGLLYKLMQLLTDTSCLAATVDSANGSLDHQACQSLLDDCLALERRYLNFYTEISVRGNHEDPPTYNRGEIKTGISTTEDLFGPAYRFLSVSEANLHIFFWTSLSLVYPIVYQAYILAKANKIPELLRIDGQSPQRAAHQLSAFYISKAVRCLPYGTQEGMNSWAAFHGIFVAAQASRVFSQTKDWERFVWISESVQYIAPLGFDLASRFHEICWSHWLEPSRHSSYRLPDYKEISKGYHGSARDGVAEQQV